MTTRVRVDIPGRPYEVVVGRGALREVGAAARLADGARRAAIVTQGPIAEHHAAAVEQALTDVGLDVVTLVIDDGERAKNLGTVEQLYAALARIPLERQDLVVALGGGVVGDIAGFVAATWHRGVPVLQVPTTLLAQVDAAIGGKTAVDLPEGKNLVGAFHQPLAVVADVDTLGTLPPRELRAGLAEVVKCGLIRDPEILDVLEERTADVLPDGADGAPAGGDGAPAGGDGGDLLTEVIRRAVAVKAAVVASDERESGERQHLNLGHTYGHALEACTGYERFLHGEAVAIGLVVALRIGVELEVTPPEVAQRTETLLGKLGLPTRAPAVDRTQLWEAMRRDKKARGAVRFVVVEELGRCAVLEPPPEVVDRAIAAVEEPG